MNLLIVSYFLIPGIVMKKLFKKTIKIQIVFQNPLNTILLEVDKAFNQNGITAGKYYSISR